MKQVWRTYYKAFLFALRHWRMWGLLYFFNVAYCYLAVFPVRSWLSAAFAQSTSLTRLSTEFDFNILMDLLRDNSAVFALALPLVLIALILYFLWISFFVGAVIKCYIRKQFEFHRFFSDGFMYFFKNLRLSIYIVAFYIFLVVIGFLIYARNGFNVLNMEDETGLVFEFQLITTVIFTIAFFTGIFKEIMRVQIVRKDLRWFFRTLPHAFANMFKPDYLLLGFFNLIGLVLVVVLHYLIVRSPGLNSELLLMLLLSQALLLLRMILKVTRLGSFYIMSESEDL